MEVRDSMDLGQQLQIYRESKKVTQAEMAKFCGLSKNYISAIERGINNCSAHTLISYAEKLDISIDELVGRKNTNAIIPELQIVLSHMTDSQQQKILQLIKIINEK